LRDQVERLVPGDGDESRILTTALPRIGPLHRVEDAVGIVEFLHQSEGFDAGFATGRMDLSRIEIGGNLGRNAVLDAYLEEIWTGDALVAIGGNRALAVARDASRGRWHALLHHGSPAPAADREVKPIGASADLIRVQS